VVEPGILAIPGAKRITREETKQICRVHVRS